MPSIRLNASIRSALKDFARKKIEATPVDETDLKASRRALIAAHTALSKSIIKDIEAMYPKGTMDVLKKLSNGSTPKTSYPLSGYVDRHSTVTLVYHLNQPVLALPDGSIPAHSFTFAKKCVDRDEVGKDYDFNQDIRDSAPLVPLTHKETSPIKASAATAKLLCKYTEAHQKLNAEKRKIEQATYGVLRAIYALIDTSYTFERVCEVWPEAKEMAGEINGDGNGIVLLTSDAINSIKENMKARGVKP